MMQDRFHSQHFKRLLSVHPVILILIIFYAINKSNYSKKHQIITGAFDLSA